MMKRLFWISLLSLLFFVSNSNLAQAPVMTSWVSDAANNTEIQLRMHDRTINQGYSLVEVSFSMSAARCALSDEVRIYVYQNDGSGSYGTLRYSVAFDPGPGAVPISTSEMTRILVESSGSTEPIYARAVISGVLPADDFVLTTPDCNTTIVTSDSYDPNEAYTVASSISSGTHEGLIVNNDADWYEFTIPSSPLELIVSMEYLNDYRTGESNLDLDLFLAGSTGSTLTSSTSSATSTTGSITEMIDEILDPGTYYIVVRPKGTESNRNFYTLNWHLYTPPHYQLSGIIRDDQNNRLQSVTMNGLPGSISTDVTGFYGVSLISGWDGTVTPEREGYTFTPESRTYSDLSQGLVSENYLATPITPTVSGRVTDGLGQGVEGVTLVGFPTTVLTDADGYYSTTVPYDWSGTILPDYAGLDFTPVVREYSHLQTDVGDQDYTGSITMCFVQGYTLLAGIGDAIPGVLLDGSPGQLVTDINGYYYFEVPYGSDVSLTPILANYNFTPPVYTIENISTNYSADFQGSLVTYLINGEIRDQADAGLAGVQLSGLPGNPLTLDGSGHYYAYVEHGWSGTVTPVLDGYSFTPVSTTYSNVTSETTTDYTATRLPYLNVSQHIILLGAEAGADSPVAVTSNVDWTVSCPAAWITCSPATGSDDGAFTVTANSANTGTASRETTITVTGGGITRTMDVSQMGSDPMLEVSSTTASISAAAASIQTVDITSNIAWTVSETADWLSVAPASGSGDESLTLTADLANESTASRSATVTVTGGGITRNIEVTQAGSDPFLGVSSSAVTLAAPAASSQTVDITSNIAWTVSETADWLSVAPLSGSGNSTLTLSADLPNESLDPRSTTVTLSGSGITRNIEVTQAGADPVLELSSATVTLGAASASSQTLDITSNTDWTVSEAVNWLSVTPVSGSGNGSLIFTADQANASTDPRSTTVTVSGGGLTRTIAVTQSGAGAILMVSTTTVSLGANVGASQTVSITSNTAWTASESSEWLTVSPASGSNNGVISISAASANEVVTSRSSTVTVAGGGITHNIEVTQAGNGAILEVSSTSVALGASLGATQTVTITSNLTWTASETANWLSVSPGSGSNDGLITITSDMENSQVDPKIATVTVAGGGISHDIEVTQAGSDPSLGASSPSENLGAAAGSFFNLTIFSNIAWTASLDENWVSVSPSSGTGDQVVTILADSTNTAETERIATLTLEGGGMTRTLTITQDGTDYTGIDPFEQIKLELYPNPSRDYVYLQSSMEVLEEVSIEVLSTSGRVLSQVQLPALIPDEPVQIDLSSYPAGQYLIRVGNDRIQRVHSIIKTQ